MLMAPDEFDPKACCRKRTCAHTARTEQMNVSHGAQAWINRALAEDEGGGDEPADMWLSVLLTKLQLQAADVSISGLGWLSIGALASLRRTEGAMRLVIDVWVPKGVEVSLRPPMPISGLPLGVEAMIVEPPN